MESKKLVSKAYITLTDFLIGTHSAKDYRDIERQTRELYPDPVEDHSFPYEKNSLLETTLWSIKSSSIIPKYIQPAQTFLIGGLITLGGYKLDYSPTEFGVAFSSLIAAKSLLYFLTRKDIQKRRGILGKYKEHLFSDYYLSEEKSRRRKGEDY